MTRSAFFAGIDARVQDADGRLTQDIQEACMQQALQEYSRERPLKQVAELMADGESILNLPETWVPNFSRLLRLEVVTLGEPELVAAKDYRLRLNTDGDPEVLWLKNIPAEGTICILSYTAIHTISDTESSYSSGDDEALMDLAASHASLRLAAAYINDVDPEIGTITLNNTTRSNRYQSLAKDLAANYQRTVSKARGAAAGRSRFVIWQQKRLSL